MQRMQNRANSFGLYRLADGANPASPSSNVSPLSPTARTLLGVGESNYLRQSRATSMNRINISNPLIGRFSPPINPGIQLQSVITVNPTYDSIRVHGGVAGDFEQQLLDYNNAEGAQEDDSMKLLKLQAQSRGRTISSQNMSTAGARKNTRKTVFSNRQLSAERRSFQTKTRFMP